MNLMKRMAQTTEGLDETPLAPPKPRNKKAERPETAPGKSLQWAIDKQRMTELERHRAGTPIEIAKLVPNPYQPRIEFDPEKIDELAESIRIHGLIEPIVVRKHPSLEGHYQIVVGERRVRAHKVLGLTEIPSILSECTDEEMATIALAENVARADLSDFEISQALLAMRSRYEQVTVMAEKLGMSRKQLYRYFAFEKLPEFVLASLRDKPQLLGARAVDELVSVLNEHGAQGEKALLEIWPRYLAGDFQQTKLAAKLRQAITTPDAGVSRRSIELFLRGKKIGAFHCDSNGLRLNIKGIALTEDLEKRIGQLLEELFPDRQPETTAAAPAVADEQTEPDMQTGAEAPVEAVDATNETSTTTATDTPAAQA